MERAWSNTKSGLRIREEYAYFDAIKRYGIEIKNTVKKRLQMR